MKPVRILTASLIVWLLVFTTFMTLDMAGVKVALQNITVIILVILFSWLAASWYYKTGSTTHGVTVGLLMTPIILLLDALITVPFIMIPINIGFADFYSDYNLWVLIVENIVVTYVYWLFKVKPLSITGSR